MKKVLKTINNKTWTFYIKCKTGEQHDKRPFELSTPELEKALTKELTEFNKTNSNTTKLYGCTTQDFTFRLTSNNNVKITKSSNANVYDVTVGYGMSKELSTYLNETEEYVHTVLYTLLDGLRLHLSLEESKCTQKDKQLY